MHQKLSKILQKIALASSGSTAEESILGRYIIILLIVTMKYLEHTYIIIRIIIRYLGIKLMNGFI